LAVNADIYRCAVAFSVRVLAADDDSVPAMFAALSRLIAGGAVDDATAHHILLAAKLLLDLLAGRLGADPSGPFLRRKLVTADVSAYFDAALWYPFVMKYSSGASGQAALAALVSVAPPSLALLESAPLDDFSQDALAAILSRWPAQFLARFVANALAPSSPIAAKYFAAIVAQFVFGGSKAMLARLANALAAPANDDFTTAAFGQTGALLALSFVYVARELGAVKIQAYQLMVVVAVGSALCVEKPDWAVRLLSRATAQMFTVRSQLTNLSVPALVSLSSMLASELAFCTEQFICQILAVLRVDQSEQAKLARILAPWVHGARFDIAQPVVFPQTDPRFVSYTFYSLVRDLSDIPLTSDMFLIIDNLLHIPDQPAVAGYVIRFLYSFWQEGADPGRLVSFLGYVLQHRPEEGSLALIELLRLPFWYHHRARDREAEWERGVALAVRSMATAFRQFPDKFTDHYAPAYAFALVVAEHAEALLPAMLPGLEADAADNDALIFREFQRRGTAFQEALGREALMWGLCCGDLACAARGLALYRRFPAPISGAVITKLVANIRNVAQVAAEKTSPVFVEYVTGCWETLRVVVDRLREAREDVFELCCEFLSCGQPEILSTIFTVMSFWLSFPEMITKIRSRERAVLLRGKLRTPFELQAGEGFFSLLLAIARADLGSVAASNEVLAVVLLLTFPIYGRGETDRTFFAIGAITIGDPEAAANLTKLSLSGEDDAVLMLETALLIASTMADEDIQVVGNLLGALLAGSGFKQCTHVYAFIAALLANGRSPTCFMYFVALTDRDTEKAGMRGRLLELYGAAGGLKVRVQSDVTALPCIAPRDCLAGVSARVGFAEVEEFAPLYVSGLEFAQCPSVKKVKDIVEKLAIEPVHTWFLEIALAQKATVDPGSKRAPSEVRVGGADIAAKLTRLADAAGIGVAEELPLKTIAEGTLEEENA
jgi:hypothetical protein